MALEGHPPSAPTATIEVTVAPAIMRTDGAQLPACRSPRPEWVGSSDLDEVSQAMRSQGQSTRLQCPTTINTIDSAVCNQPHRPTGQRRNHTNRTVAKTESNRNTAQAGKRDSTISRFCHSDKTPTPTRNCTGREFDVCHHVRSTGVRTWGATLRYAFRRSPIVFRTILLEDASNLSLVLSNLLKPT